MYTCKKCGLEFENRSKLGNHSKSHRMTDREWQGVLYEFANGTPVYRIAAPLGVGAKTLIRMLIQAGVAVQKGHRQSVLPNPGFMPPPPGAFQQTQSVDPPEVGDQVTQVSAEDIVDAMVTKVLSLQGQVDGLKRSNGQLKDRVKVLEAELETALEALTSPAADVPPTSEGSEEEEEQHPGVVGRLLSMVKGAS